MKKIYLPLTLAVSLFTGAQTYAGSITPSRLDPPVTEPPAPSCYIPILNIPIRCGSIGTGIPQDNDRYTPREAPVERDAPDTTPTSTPSEEVTEAVDEAIDNTVNDTVDPEPYDC